MSNVAEWLTNIGMAVGPILGYVSQYRLISSTKQVGSFSIDICGILLFANILRLNFYIFERYQLTLLFQSLFMITMQILLVYQCSKYPQKKNQQQNAAQESQPALRPSEGHCNNIQKFWRWNKFQKYGVAILFFIFCTFLASLIMNMTPIAKPYGQLVGFVALASQSILILPQIIKNYQKKSTKGLSHLLVTLNLSGDIFKLVYFLIKQQPVQFVMCGIIQVILDSYVIIQIFYYKTPETGQRKKKQFEVMSPIKPKKIKEQRQTPQSDMNLNYEIKSMRSEPNNEEQMQNNSPKKGDKLPNTNNVKANTQDNLNRQTVQNKNKVQDYYSLNQQIEIQGQEQQHRSQEQQKESKKQEEYIQSKSAIFSKKPSLTKKSSSKKGQSTGQENIQKNNQQ